MKRSLGERIWGRIRMTVSAFRQDCRFSVRLALYRMIDDLSWRLGLRKISAHFHQKKDQYILGELERMLRPVIEKFEGDTQTGEYVENAPVWVCWWSGEENAPPLVKQCIRSIRKQAGKHLVHLVTEQTIGQYLDIPEYIVQHVRSKHICLANLSDYLRFSLLEKYGGIWLDATIYCSATIPEEYFSEQLFSCKTYCPKSRYVSNYRWTSFCFAGWKKHQLFRFFKEAWEYYWKLSEQAIDYLLVDYLIEIAYSKLPVVRKDINHIPENNPHRDDLQAAMNAALAAEDFETVLNADTVLYKLSWRESYSLKTADGKPSVYARFLSIQDWIGGIDRDTEDHSLLLVRRKSKAGTDSQVH